MNRTDNVTNESSVGVFKLADEAQMGGLSSLMLGASCGVVSGTVGGNNKNNCDKVEQSEINALTTTTTSNHLTDKEIPLSNEPFSNMRDHAARMQSDSLKHKLNNKNKVDTNSDVKKGGLKRKSSTPLYMSEAELNYNYPGNTKTLPNKELINYSDSRSNDEVLTKISPRACKGKRYKQFGIGIGSGGGGGDAASYKSTTPIHTKKLKTNKIMSAPPQPPPPPVNFHNGSKPTITTATTTTSTVSLAEPIGGVTTANADVLSSQQQSSFVNTLIESDDETKRPKRRKRFNARDYELDQKIFDLPALSLDKYMTRKQETKKKKKINSEYFLLFYNHPFQLIYF